MKLYTKRRLSKLNQFTNNSAVWTPPSNSQKVDTDQGGEVGKDIIET